MRISDWSSDVCSSDLGRGVVQVGLALVVDRLPPLRRQPAGVVLAPARLLAGHVDAAKQGEDDPREDKAVVAHLRQGENAQAPSHGDQRNQHLGSLENADLTAYVGLIELRRDTPGDEERDSRNEWQAEVEPCRPAVVVLQTQGGLRFGRAGAAMA